MPEQNDKANVQEKKKSSVLKYVIIGLFLMIVIPVSGFFVATKLIFNSTEEKKVAADTNQMGIIFPLDVIVVNIADSQATRYLRAGISFEIPNETVAQELTLRKPQITDLLIMILSSKEMEDLIDFSGKNQIRKEIMEKVNSKLSGEKLKNVYFTEFVIQ